MILKKSLFRRVILLFFLASVFCLLHPSFHAQAASDPQVVALAKKHRLSSVSFKEIVTSRGKTKLVCYSGGKRLKRKNYWFYANGSVYYNNSRAFIQTGCFTYKGFHYRAESDGELLVNRLKSPDGSLYYYGPTGARLSDGWHTAGGRKRFFYANGKIAINQWIGDHYVGFDGSVISSLSRVWNPADPKADAAGWVTTASNASEKHLIIIGASRVVYMAQDVPADPRITYIAACGMEYDWFTDTALPALRYWLSVYPASKVVIQMGNNGLSPVSKTWGRYRRAYKRLLRKYPEVSFYFMDILPASPERKRNEKREIFNQALQETFPEQAIGGYDYLVEKGYDCIDYVHYTTATNRMIYSYILREIGW